jgi:integrase
MKTCVYCESTMFPSNYNRHLTSCQIKLHFNLPKQEIIRLIEENKSNLSENNSQQLKSQLYNSEHKNQQFTHFIKSIHREIAEILTKTVSESKNNPYSTIDNMILSDLTKKEYKNDWKLYSKFCEGKRLNAFLASSANEYLASLDNKVSTIIKKRSNLQSILSNLSETSIKLRRIRKKAQYRPKYALSQQEIEQYLKEQRKILYSDWLIQKILIEFGCRINTIGSLKLKHLEFLNGGNNIILPDSKTGQREEIISDNLKDELSNYVYQQNLQDEDDYIFKVPFVTTEPDRTHKITIRINKKIKLSKVLKKTSNYTFSSHMFRKTKAFQAYSKAMQKAKEIARKEIGQKDNSNAIDHYIKL